MVSTLISVAGVIAAIGLAAIFFILGALNGAASDLLADEARAMAPSLARKIAARAAARLPQGHREDQLETWLAELAELEGRPLAALRFALVNCLAAAPALTRQLRPAAEVVVEGADMTEGPELPRSGVSAVAALLLAGSRNSRGGPGALLGALRSFLGAAVATLGKGVRRTADPSGLLNEAVRWELEALQEFSEQLRRGAWAAVEGFARQLEVLGELVGEVRSLLGPYDYSREWRSVGQLLLRIVAMVVLLSVAFPLLWIAGSFVVGLVVGS